MDAFDQIGAEAAGQEAEIQAAQDAFLNPPEPEPLQPPGQAWAMIPLTIGMFGAQIIPELKDIFTESACSRWGDAMALVAEKYGWDAGETMAKWGPECALAVATLPLALPTIKVLKERKAAADAEKAAKKLPAPAPLQAIDTPQLAPQNDEIAPAPIPGQP